MAVCAEYRIPHKVFLRDWDKDDRDKAIWWHVRQRSACRMCGTRREEWDERQGGHRHAYLAELDRCPGCEQIEQLQSSIADDHTVGKGVRVILRPNPRR